MHIQTKSKIKVFLHFLAPFMLFVLMGIDLQESFQVSFKQLTARDFLQLIVLLMVKTICAIVVIDTYVKHDEMKAREKNGLIVIAIISALILAFVLSAI
ncbi:hypothetical protein AWM68_02950 [Fictibacillus phosphorivorans]|uniref:Uncharacterized protein n=1 Tax=Fictibacillus phosphorivorans TaxID=1221500 RepID=A0A161TS44_9BACL|nr:hypothetical protein [Fictibacillus phosphorivorans]KZE69241.1 hypothetical protein AWM68_02950 [Fictibacillus phosphorivorans]